MRKRVVLKRVGQDREQYTCQGCTVYRNNEGVVAMVHLHGKVFSAHNKYISQPDNGQCESLTIANVEWVQVFSTEESE